MLKIYLTYPHEITIFFHRKLPIIHMIYAIQIAGSTRLITIVNFPF